MIAKFVPEDENDFYFKPKIHAVDNETLAIG
jgi:hypothetical protein